MKITMRDLDSTIIEKLRLLDNVAATYDENNPDGFVSYSPNGFYFKKTNDTFLKKVFTEDEVVDLEAALYQDRKNVVSSYNEDFRLDDKYNKAAQKFLYKIDTFDTEFDNDIVRVEKFKSGLTVLLDNGLLKNTKTGVEVNILEILRTNFNLSNQLDVYHIVRVLEMDAETVLVLTSDFGVYKISLSTLSAELIVSAKGVKDGAITEIGTLFLATNEFCAQYDLQSNLRTEKYANISNQRQIPEQIIQTGSEIFVMASPAGAYTTENLLHVWKLDEAGMAYNCKDKVLPLCPVDKDYQVLFVDSTDSAIFLVGKINGKIFIWKFDLGTYKLSEEIITCVDSIQFNGFLSISDMNLFLIKNKLFLIKDNEIVENLLLDDVCKGLMFYENEIYTVKGNILAKIELPKFETKPENLSFRIYEREEACNNIDIFVKGGTRNERLTLIDMDTNKEIPPSYYFVYGKNSIMKLMNCRSKRIKMLISVNANSSIEGIVVKNNRMFLR